MPQSWWFLVPQEVYGAKPAAILMGVWSGVGRQHAAVHGGLTGVPPELYEAAEMDGPGPWRQFRDITLADDRAHHLFIMVMAWIGGLQGGFEVAYMMTAAARTGRPPRLVTTSSSGFQDFRVRLCRGDLVPALPISPGDVMNWRLGNRADGDDHARPSSLWSASAATSSSAARAHHAGAVPVDAHDLAQDEWEVFQPSPVARSGAPGAPTARPSSPATAARSISADTVVDAAGIATAWPDGHRDPPRRAGAGAHGNPFLLGSPGDRAESDTGERPVR